MLSGSDVPPHSVKIECVSFSQSTSRLLYPDCLEKDQFMFVYNQNTQDQEIIVPCQYIKEPNKRYTVFSQLSAWAFI